MAVRYDLVTYNGNTITQYDVNRRVHQAVDHPKKGEITFIQGLVLGGQAPPVPSTLIERVEYTPGTNQGESRFVAMLKGSATEEQITELYMRALKGEFDSKPSTVVFEGSGAGIGPINIDLPTWLDNLISGLNLPDLFFVLLFAGSSVQLARKKTPLLWGALAIVSGIKTYNYVKKLKK